MNEDNSDNNHNLGGEDSSESSDSHMNGSDKIDQVLKIVTDLKTGQQQT